MTERFAAKEDGARSVAAEADRKRLAALYAAELASRYDDARLSLEEPVLLLIERNDSLGSRFLDNWSPRPVKWLRRARRMESGALQPEFQILAKELNDVWASFEAAGVANLLHGFSGDGLSVAIVAFEGVTVVHIDLGAH